METHQCEMNTTSTRLCASVVLPAHNEAGFIAECLTAVITSDMAGIDLRVVVVANGCTDETADIARGFVDPADKAGIDLQVLETQVGGKINALNLGDDAACAGVRLYLDADVIVSASLIRDLITKLLGDTPRYACGTPVVLPGENPVTRAYARFWNTLPFVANGTPGFGLFAMNATGRTGWKEWPDVISDDTFARLQFEPDMRVKLPATYEWPMVQGFANLVRVRRRQDRGVREIEKQHPHLLANDDKVGISLGGVLARAIRDPIGFVVYATVSLAVRMTAGRDAKSWTRGR